MHPSNYQRQTAEMEKQQKDWNLRSQAWCGANACASHCTYKFEQQTILKSPS